MKSGKHLLLCRSSAQFYTSCQKHWRSWGSTLKEKDVDFDSSVQIILWLSAQPVAQVFAWFVASVVWFVRLIILWPVFLDNRRLYKTFGIRRLDEDSHQSNQALVQEELRSRAAILKDAFDRQEAARRQSPIDRDELANADEGVRLSKREFWQALDLAGRNGFAVMSSYRNYLSIRGDQSRPAAVAARPRSKRLE